MRLPVSVRLAIEQADTRLGARVRQLRELDELKRELGRTIKRLSLVLEATSARAGEDLVWIPGGLAQPSDSGPASVEDIEQRHRKERTWRRVLQMAAELPPAARRAVAARMRAEDIVRRAELEASLEQLHRRMAALLNAGRTLTAELGRWLGAPEARPLPA